MTGQINAAHFVHGDFPRRLQLPTTTGVPQRKLTSGRRQPTVLEGRGKKIKTENNIEKLRIAKELNQLLRGRIVV